MTRAGEGVTFYWLAQRMRATQSISATASSRGACGIERDKLHHLFVAAAKHLGHHFSPAMVHDDAIAAPHRRAWLHDDDVAGAKHRLHGIAGDLERVSNT